MLFDLKNKKNMKKVVLIFLSILTVNITTFGYSIADNADAIIGFWKTGDGKGIVQIYKQGDAYFGKIVWLQEPNDPKTGKPKLDTKNDDPIAKTKPILGLVNLRDFKFIKKDSWKEGKIYDPKTGNDYSSKITMIDMNTIEVRGYVGISLIGKTDTWKRQTMPIK